MLLCCFWFVRVSGLLSLRLRSFACSPTPQSNTCLIIDGPTLKLVLEHVPLEFLELACQAPSVICCRCTPTQKADIVSRMKAFTGRRVCAIGDGGNDVAMIQAADVGVGIVGKEGKQASMAADFSIDQFSFVVHLLLWHGRNSYKRSVSARESGGYSTSSARCFSLAYLLLLFRLPPPLPFSFS